MKEKLKIPESLQAAIDQVLQKRFGLSLQDSSKLAKSVLRLSDHYTANEKQITTPWTQEFCQIASLCYYLPLNYLRNQSVLKEAQRLGFFKTHNITQARDFGAGLGAASLALKDTVEVPFYWQDIESSPEALSLLQDLRRALNFSPKTANSPGPMLGLFSYSLTELAKAPSWIRDCEALILVEPSTRQQSRRFLELRQNLIEEGFHVWAPCTHQQICPMLSTQNDFCHDRILFEAPVWLTHLEEHLPLKNKSLTYSYLVLGRKPAPDFSHWGRLVGDSLEENGKTRQMVCFGPERQFLTWMHRKGPAQTLPRGLRVNRPTEFELKSNEIRVTQVQVED